MNKRSLVILIPGFPKDEQDTSCLPAFQQFVLSVKKLYPALRLIVVSLQYPFERKQYTWNGIEVVAIGGRNRKKAFALQTWYRAYQTLRKIHRQQKDMALLSFWMTDCALVGNYFSKKYKVRQLTWIIGQDARAGNKHVARIRPAAEQLIAMSDFLQDEFEKNYAVRPAHVIPNGITEAMFPALNQAGRPIDVCGAGSLIPLKNYRLFINIIAALKKSLPSIRACIAGNGEEKQALSDLVKQRGLEHNIVLLGQQTHAEVLKLMSGSKVFLHTSHYEGNSTVLAEALYSGCKVMSTQPLSKKEIPGLFVSSDEEALTGKMLETLSQPLIHERVVFNTMERSAKRMLELLLQ